MFQMIIFPIFSAMKWLAISDRKKTVALWPVQMSERKYGEQNKDKKNAGGMTNENVQGKSWTIFKDILLLDSIDLRNLSTSLFVIVIFIWDDICN